MIVTSLSLLLTFVFQSPTLELDVYGISRIFQHFRYFSQLTIFLVPGCVLYSVYIPMLRSNSGSRVHVTQTRRRWPHLSLCMKTIG